MATAAPESVTFPEPVRVIVERFTAACNADPSVLAAFICGSYARGAADAHSDVDLGMIVAEEAYEAALNSRAALAGRLGEPLFLETFSPEGPLFFILADGTEGELAVGRAGDFGRMAMGPYRVLLDKVGLLDGVTFAGEQPAPDEQRDTLRRLVTWFWHDVAHFITAVVRGQRWWAYGELEVLRRSCAALLRLQADPADASGDEPYFKVDTALPAAQLAPLRETLCASEPAAMVRAAEATVRLYRSLAVPLAGAHGLAYPHALDRLLSARLEELK